MSPHTAGSLVAFEGFKVMKTEVPGLQDVAEVNQVPPVLWLLRFL